MENLATKVPQIKKIPKELKIHGDTRIDNYYWLNDRENPEVIEYLNAENAYRESEMKHTEHFQSQLFEEIKGRIKEQDQSVPYKKKGYWFYVRFEIGQEHPIYCRKKGSMEAEEEVLLNVNYLAKDQDFYQIGGMSISPDNQWLAFGEDKLSRRIYTIRFKNLQTGEISEEKIENTTGSVAWAEDSSLLFYTVKDETLRPSKIMRHKKGGLSSDDVLIYTEEDSTFTTFIYKSKSEKFLIIANSSTVSNEYWYLDSSRPMGEFSLFQKRERDLEYGIAHFQDQWYIHTNKDGASNFKLMTCSLNATSKEDWKELIPHRADVYLEGVDLFKNHLVLEERSNGLSKIRIKKWADNSEHYLVFPEETYTASTGNNPDFDTEILRFAYSSLSTPASVFDYNMNTRERELKKQMEVIGGYNASEYQSERIWAKAKDGVVIPISLVYKKSLKKEDGNPLLLYGYGSYGATMDPSFSSTRLSLLDRGFIFAIAHIRGGEYLGRDWYEKGKMLHKKNTFSDFIACGEKLIEDKYSNPNKLYGLGGSAGGLLIGAVINQKPELFKGVIAAVPFVDVITTMLDETIPLTTGEYDEWGNPNQEEYYHYMKSYSPYDNVEAKDYPAILITTGLHDSQVQYWEPAKWTAKLREYKTDKNPLYLFTNMDTGHGGASGRFEAYKETAMEYAFLFDLEGIKD
tara:strand:- start:2582 stop:4639 length:2058 start_codon:yes stop_codon:yes gene_type:complete